MRIHFFQATCIIGLLLFKASADLGAYKRALLASQSSKPTKKINMKGSAETPDVLKINPNAPVLTEEEQKSLIIPKKYQCDACKAIAWEMDLALHTVENYPYRPAGMVGARLTEMNEPSFEDVLVKVCDFKTFKGYGMKRVDIDSPIGPAGTLALSGQGTFAHTLPGTARSGGASAIRMSKQCGGYLELLDPDDGVSALYDLYVFHATMKGSQGAAAFMHELCVTHTGHCRDEIGLHRRPRETPDNMLLEADPGKPSNPKKKKRTKKRKKKKKKREL